MSASGMLFSRSMKASGGMPAQVFEVARGGFAQVAFPALEFGDELVAHQGALCVASLPARVRVRAG